MYLQIDNNFNIAAFEEASLLGKCLSRPDVSPTRQ